MSRRSDPVENSEVVARLVKGLGWASAFVHEERSESVIECALLAALVVATRVDVRRSIARGERRPGSAILRSHRVGEVS